MTDQTPSARTSPAHRPSPSFAATDSTVFGRNTGYFDAVYGFAATLLISNVDAPPASAWQSWDALVASGAPTQALGFALSFTIIAVFWRVNVRLTRRLTGLDGPTTFLNLVAAASVVFIAFTTQGISDPNSAGLPLPTALYAFNLALVALAQTATFQLARARGLEKHPHGARKNAAEVAAALVVPFLFLVSIPVAFAVDAQAAKWVWASMLVFSPAAGILAGRVR